MGAAFGYFLCVKNPEQAQKRRYGALGARDPDADSDGDEADDPRERRRMLELSSFGGENTGSGAYRRGRRGDATTAAESGSARETQSRGSFPLASFAASSDNSNSSGRTSNRAGNNP